LDVTLVTIKGNDYEISLFSGLYLHFFKKEILGLRTDIETYLSKCWILNENIFDNIQTVYPDEEYVNLNLQPNLRPLDQNKDRGISMSVDKFFDKMRSLRAKWYQLPFLPRLPEYQSGSESITLKQKDVTISIYPDYKNVRLWDWDGTEIKFSSSTDQEEKFTYLISTELKGYFKNHAKEVSGKVTVIDWLTLYRTSIAENSSNLSGNWICDNYFGGVFGVRQYKRFMPDGSVLLVKNEHADGTIEDFGTGRFQESWSVVKDATGYHLSVSGARTYYPYVLKYPVTYMLGGTSNSEYIYTRR
jgi:hypothetical protein